MTKIPFSMLSALSIASQEEAEAGAATDKLMTPQRVMQAMLTPAWSNLADYYTAGESTVELVTSLPINGAEQVVMSVGPLDLTDRDLIIAMGEAQFTNEEASLNDLVTSRLILATSDSSVTVVQELSEANGRNITPGMHHDAHVRCTMVRSTLNSSTHHLNWISRGASSSGTLDVTVDQDYGRLYALVLKNFFPAE